MCCIQPKFIGLNLSQLNPKRVFGKHNLYADDSNKILNHVY